ncbi:peroxide stress protein YaaA [Alcaligenaceae bacterium A4P071]|nr:peroxide stress protein YaaA [Alcaligenaceae bacterium C4P045]MDQ2186898.1 peroxide stress protein YaaA [Alcaligenaceae bacterium A4P071]
MLLLLSPAKKLDYDSPLHIKKHTQPLFVEQAEQLIDVLKTKSAKDIAKLMDLSEALSELNAQRYAEWTPTFTPENARQAVLAFNGDVYEGLEAPSLSAKQLDWAQQHVAILSGLYGVLRPLDLMQPYRLEMGTRLKTDAGANLYAFWGESIAQYLNERQKKDADPVVINLASEEYFKSVNKKVLKARVVQCVFQEHKAGAYKIVSFYAKRARGLMARYAIENSITAPEGLQGFDKEGYRYDAKASTPDSLVFRRKQD